MEKHIPRAPIPPELRKRIEREKAISRIQRAKRRRYARFVKKHTPKSPEVLAEMALNEKRHLRKIEDREQASAPKAPHIRGLGLGLLLGTDKSGLVRGLIGPPDVPQETTKSIKLNSEE